MVTHPEFINPPPDVQAAVAAVIKACGEWHPTQVPNLPPSLPTASQATPGLTEAQVCGFIADPAHEVWFAFGTGIFVTLLVVMVVLVLGVHRRPGALWRVARPLFPKRAAQ